ncbi:MAG: hypothetical protein HC906_07365 [Bacteroidales bacterium]|nr:hypothetical protein [Bacteroidales bacterium]
MILLIYSCSNEMVVKDSEITEDLVYTQKRKKPFSGHYIVEYKNSNCKKEDLTYVKGKLHGPAFGFFKDGKVKWKGNYHNGMMHGKWEFWDEAGEKRYELNYVNDTLHGSFIAWNDQGSIVENYQYFRNKKLK